MKNGVEILNYKSNDQIIFGDIKSMETNGGENYDVINPPILNISDVTGVGATGICGVTGQLEEQELLIQVLILFQHQQCQSQVAIPKQRQSKCRNY